MTFVNAHRSECHTITWLLGVGGGLLKRTKKNKKYDMNIDIDNMSVFPHHNH